jgi:chromosome segregation ATPase
MTKRDEYAEKLKTQIDEWNAELDRFEGRMNAAAAEARQKYQEELNALRQRRDDMLQELARVQQATDDAWDEVWRGAEEAWQTMKDAFSRARSKFNE